MRSLKQQLLFLVIGPLVILSIIGSVITMTYMKDRATLATNTKAESDLETGEEIINLMYPGPWKVQEGILYKGDAKINNNFAAVDKVAKLTGDTVTIFLGDTRVSTTVRLGNGNRAVGTKVSDPVAKKTLKHGQMYLGEANVVGEWYQTAYKPIRDTDGNIIGMFYVGISKNLSNELISNSLVTIVIISVILTIVVSLAAWFFAQKVIIGPLQQITTSTKEVATGQLNKKVKVSGTKEIGELADAFNQMVEGLQGFATHIAKVTGTEQVNISPVVKSEDSSTDVKREDVSTDVEETVTSDLEKEIKLEELPKGLNEATLKQIIAFIRAEKTAMSAEEIGEGVSLTRVTARRYLEYLEEINYVEVELKYGTVGRPVKLYKLV